MKILGIELPEKITLKDYCKLRDFSDEGCTAFAVWLGAYALQHQWVWQWDLWREAWQK